MSNAQPIAATMMIAVEADTPLVCKALVATKFK